MKTDVMVDLETLATSNNALVLSIGACRFDPFDSSGIENIKQDSFYVNIDIDGYDLYPGVFETDPRTVEWWLNQSDEALDALDADPITPRDAIYRFRDWLKGGGEFSHIWAKGPDFDLAILSFYFSYFALPVPWKYNQKMDVRTTMQNAERIWSYKPVVDTGTKHNSLDDAIAQALTIQKIYQHRNILR